MIILIILEILLLIFIALLILILLVPINYKACGQKYEKISIEANITWFFEAVDFSAGYSSETGADSSLKIFGKRRVSVEKNEEKEEKKKKSKGAFGIRDYLDRELIKSGAQFIKSFFRHLKPREFFAKGRIGLEDPFDTSIMCSITGSLNLTNFYVEPVFDDEVIEGNFIIRGRLILGVIIMLFIRFLLTRPVRNIIIRRIKEKIMQKKKGEKIHVKQSR